VGGLGEGRGGTVSVSDRAAALQRLPQNRPALQIASPANATTARHRLLVRSGAPREVLSLTLASRLQRIGKRGVYLHTPQSPSPTAYALLAVASDAAAPVRVFPSLEAMRLAFFSLEADWALLELKRWDYRALELLLAEGVEVWVLAIPSPERVALRQDAPECSGALRGA
jgi:hypothetical protein